MIIFELLIVIPALCNIQHIGFSFLMFFFDSIVFLLVFPIFAEE